MEIACPNLLGIGAQISVKRLMAGSGFELTCTPRNWNCPYLSEWRTASVKTELNKIRVKL